MMKSRAIGALFFGAVVLGVAGLSFGSIIPGAANVHWNANFKGFGDLEPVEGELHLRSITQLTSPLNHLGVVSPPVEFTSGGDSVGDDFQSQFRSFLLLDGLKVHGLHQAVEDGDGGIQYVFHDEASAVVYLATGQLKVQDAVHFGAIDGTPRGYMIEDVAANNPSGSVVGQSMGWSPGDAGFMTPTTFQGSTAAGQFVVDLATDLVALEMEMVDLSGVRAKADVVAPAGTYFTQLISSAGLDRTPAIFNVVGGLEAHKILQDGVYIDLFTVPGGTQRYTADLIGTVGGQLAPSAAPYDINFSDPVNFVTIPEPASLLMWAGLGLAAFLAHRRRRK